MTTERPSHPPPPPPPTSQPPPPPTSISPSMNGAIVLTIGGTLERPQKSASTMGAAMSSPNSHYSANSSDSERHASDVGIYEIPSRDKQDRSYEAIRSDDQNQSIAKSIDEERQMLSPANSSSGCSSGSSNHQRSSRNDQSDSPTQISSSDEPEHHFESDSKISIGECQEYYTQRVKYLERFKENLPPSIADRLEAENPDGSHSENYPSQSKKGPSEVDQSESPMERKLSQLKVDMVSLMEKDVTLMRQLLALSETMEEMKGLSVIGMDEDDDEDDSSFPASDESEDFEEDLSSGPETNHKIVNSQTLLVNASPAPRRRKQYFARQNSVLRIPIPPSHRRLSRRTLPSNGGSSIDETDDNPCEPFEPAGALRQVFDRLSDRGSSSGMGSCNNSTSSGSMRSSVGGSRPNSILLRKGSADNRRQPLLKNQGNFVGSTTTIVDNGYVDSNDNSVWENHQDISRGCVINGNDQLVIDGQRRSDAESTRFVFDGATRGDDEIADQLSPLGIQGSSIIHLKSPTFNDRSSDRHESQASIDSGIHVLSPSNGPPPSVEPEVFV